MTVIDLPQRGRATHTPFKIELFTGDNLAAAQWPAITDSRDLKMYAFQSREFLEVWLNTIGKAGRIETYLIVVKDGDGRPLLHLPLAIETKFNVRLLRFTDCGVADYNAPILTAGCDLSRQDFHRLWTDILALLPSVDVIDLKKIAGEIAGVRNPLTYLDCEPDNENGHAISLRGLRDQSVAPHPSIRQRRKLRQCAKELSKLGAPTFITNPDADDLEHVTERLLELKRDKYRRTATPDFLAAPGVEAFYRAMMNPNQLGRISHLSALTVNGTVASAHLGFIGRGRFYYILPAYDTAFSRYRVGHQLLQHLIDRSVAQNFDSFDLGVGDMPYKDIWATQHLALYVHERAMTAAGRLYLQMRRLRRFVKSSGVRTWFRTAS